MNTAITIIFICVAWCMVGLVFWSKSRQARPFKESEITSLEAIERLLIAALMTGPIGIALIVIVYINVNRKNKLEKLKQEAHTRRSRHGY